MRGVYGQSSCAPEFAKFHGHWQLVRTGAQHQSYLTDVPYDSGHGWMGYIIAWRKRVSRGVSLSGKTTLGPFPSARNFQPLRSRLPRCLRAVLSRLTRLLISCLRVDGRLSNVTSATITMIAATKHTSVLPRPPPGFPLRSPSPPRRASVPPHLNKSPPPELFSTESLHVFLR